MGTRSMLLVLNVLLTWWLSWAHGRETTCDPLHVAYGDYSPKRATYRLEDEVTYWCKKGFYPESQGTTVKCTTSGWEPPPQCGFKPCDFPQIKNGSLHHENYYRPYFPVAVGKWYYYSCDAGFVTDTQETWDYLTCRRDGWSPAVPCRRQCIFNNLENGYSPPHETKYIQGDSVVVKCYPGFTLQNKQRSLTCTENGWLPAPRCIRAKSKGKCGPPPPIDNGDITTFPAPAYPSGSSVEYQCQYLYELRGNKKITCTNGRWSAPPKCLDACVISEEEMEAHKIQLKWADDEKLQWADDEKYYSKTDKSVEFTCQYGYHKISPRHAFRVTCHDGKLEYPTCG